jgi:integrase
LASAGANVKAVQRMFGHARASMTLDVYADLFDEDLNDVAANLDGGDPIYCVPAAYRPAVVKRRNAV